MRARVSRLHREGATPVYEKNGNSRPRPVLKNTRPEPRKVLEIRRGRVGKRFSNGFDLTLFVVKRPAWRLAVLPSAAVSRDVHNAHRFPLPIGLLAFPGKRVSLVQGPSSFTECWRAGLPRPGIVKHFFPRFLIELGGRKPPHRCVNSKHYTGAPVIVPGARGFATGHAECAETSVIDCVSYERRFTRNGKKNQP